MQLADRKATLTRAISTATFNRSRCASRKTAAMFSDGVQTDLVVDCAQRCDLPVLLVHVLIVLGDPVLDLALILDLRRRGASTSRSRQSRNIGECFVVYPGCVCESLLRLSHESTSRNAAAADIRPREGDNFREQLSERLAQDATI
eukprot:341560-Pleurochrysis_carterae.AAC.1